MQKIKLVVAYDGTDYHGWQIQPRDVTIVSTLEKTYAKVFGEKITVGGASRTDAGVHALGQVAQIYTALPLPADRIKKAWNGALPSSIHIRSLELASDAFHPARGVQQKTYYYNLFLRRPLPMVARYGWLYGFIHQVDWVKFDQGLQLFVGTHDFTALCKLEDDKDPMRTIDAITIKRYDSWGMVQIQIKGQSFLRYQIRRMVGYALDVARRQDRSVGYLQGVLESRDAQQSLLQADASGLCLRKILYHER